MILKTKPIVSMLDDLSARLHTIVDILGDLAHRIEDLRAAIPRRATSSWCTATAIGTYDDGKVAFLCAEAKLADGIAADLSIEALATRVHITTIMVEGDAVIREVVYCSRALYWGGGRRLVLVDTDLDVGQRLVVTLERRV